MRMVITEPAVTPPIKEEPEKIRKWREEQKARLEEKGIEISLLHLQKWMLKIFVC